MGPAERELVHAWRRSLAEGMGGFERAERAQAFREAREKALAKDRSRE